MKSKRITREKIIKWVAAGVLAAFLSAAAGAGTWAAPEQEEGGRVTDPELYKYTVARGDCLWSVARKFGIDADCLAENNGLDSDSLLFEGQSLVIPGRETMTYTVSHGDTLWGIARRFNTSVDTMLQENNLKSPELLLPGQVLTVPAALQAAATDKKSRLGLIPQLAIHPVTGIISSVFGVREGRMHEGIDIAAEHGSPIKAVAAGTVVFAGERGSYGNAVIINHGAGFRSLYGHASRLEVEQGQQVKEGQVIARVGSTGRSTGPHLHLELLFKGIPLNPGLYLPGQL
ncbi:MAG: peptidase M23 [Firmicutes bacterium HGW-Firmicutes-14]|nr:MAG: peptidase M23 [Firmicutes bacterium HGW-Firmicutes-14]